MRLTDIQMLKHWRAYRGLADEHAAGSVEVFNNADLISRLNIEMRQWYLDLLDNGDLKYLIKKDIASRLTPKRVGDGVWRITLPYDVRRLVTLEISGAEAPVALMAPGSDPRREVLNSNPYSRSGQTQPTAVVAADGTLTLYCKMSDTPVISRALAVVDPGDEEYELDESALKLLYTL